MAKQKKEKEENNFVQNLIRYFAEEHGLHTLFVVVMIILLSLFVIIVARYYLVR